MGLLPSWRSVPVAGPVGLSARRVEMLTRRPLVALSCYAMAASIVE